MSGVLKAWLTGILLAYGVLRFTCPTTVLELTASAYRKAMGSFPQKRVNEDGCIVGGWVGGRAGG